jgi:L-fuculose-phosphate aldolase
MSPFIAREQARNDIIEIGRRLYAKGLIAANEGNISIRIGPNEVVATASGVHKGHLNRGQIVPVTLNGQPVEHTRPVSTEIDMHLAAYRARPDVYAVVHAHPPVATAFAVAGVPLAQCVMPEVVVTLGGVPIAPYGTPGTREVADGLTELYPLGNAFLLANHGAVCLGSNVYAAFDLMETLEHFAQVLFHARALGNVNVLTIDQVAALLDQRQQAGVTSPVFPCDVCSHCPTPPTVALRENKDVSLGDSSLVHIASAIVQETMKNVLSASG